MLLPKAFLPYKEIQIPSIDFKYKINLSLDKLLYTLYTDLERTDGILRDIQKS